MEKEKTYYAVHFTPEVLAAVFRQMRTLNKDEGKAPLKFQLLQVEHDDAMWGHDSLEEFLADYRKYKGNALVTLVGESLRLLLSCRPSKARMMVQAPSRDEIESVFAILEVAEGQCRVQQVERPKEPPVVFIGHGRPHSGGISKTIFTKSTVIKSLHTRRGHALGTRSATP